MKYLYQIGQLIIIALLLVNCSSKELFRFSKNTGRFNSYQKEQRTTNSTDSLAIFPEHAITVQGIPDSLVLTASATNLEPTPLPKHYQLINISSALPANKIKKHAHRQVIKFRKHQYIRTKKDSVEPQTNKAVHEATIIGFILSLGAFAILLAGSPLVVLASLGGAIFSLIGLKKIKKNPEEFSGKGLAWAGIILGFLIPIFILGYLLAFAGAL